MLVDIRIDDVGTKGLTFWHIWWKKYAAVGADLTVQSRRSLSNLTKNF